MTNFLTMFRKTKLKAKLFVRYMAKDACEGKGKDKPCSRKGLVLGAYEIGPEPKLTPIAEHFNQRVQGKLMCMIKDIGDTKKSKGRGYIFNNLDPEFWSVCLVEIGKKGTGFNLLEMIDEGRENVRYASATGVIRLRNEGINQIMVEDMGGYAQEAAEGACLAAWRYQEFKNKSFRKIVPTVELFCSADCDGWKRGVVFAESQNLARWLCEGPGNVITPTGFAQITADECCPCNITVECRNKDYCEQYKMNAFLAVAKSSCEPPLLLEVIYCGSHPDDKPVVMVGKGITFDSGGLALKRRRSSLLCEYNDVILAEHRGDMAGAASIVACIKGCAMLSLPINIYGVIPLCENLPSGMAMKPGDVVRSASGKTIQIKHCDNEGRVTMCDAMSYGQDHYAPKLLVDVGTMSEGQRMLLGEACHGCFSNSRQMWKQLQRAGTITGDRCWRLPLWNYHKNLVTCRCNSDVTNKGNRLKPTEPCCAAAFLHEFVPCVDWIHMDITGTAMPPMSPILPYYRVGMFTGRPTRTLMQLMYQLACPEGIKELNAAPLSPSIPK